MLWKRSLTRRRSRVFDGSSWSWPRSKPWSESTTSVVSSSSASMNWPSELVGEDVHLLDGLAVVLLLRRQLAAELAGAEEVAEEVRRRVDALDVDHPEVGLLVAPERRGRCRGSSARWRTPT